MIDRKGFKDWLQSNTDYSKNTISTFGNRLKMGDDLVPWFLPLADYMTKLEAMYGFKSLEPAVRSQIRKVMKLYADYQYSMLDRPIAADVEVLAAPEPAAAEPVAPEAETVTEPASEPVYPEQQSLPEEEKVPEVTASERQEEEEEAVSIRPRRAPQWMNRSETFKREAPEPIKPRFVPQISRVEDEEESEEPDVSETVPETAELPEEPADPEESIVISFKCSNGRTAKLTVPDGVSDEEMKLVYDIFNMIMKRRFHVG